MPEYKDSWENPEGHEPITARARPMFDAKGNRVTTAPVAEPLTAAELALMHPAGKAGPAPVLADPVSYEEGLGQALDRIKGIARGALESDKPAQWALSLADILAVIRDAR